MEAELASTAAGVVDFSMMSLFWRAGIVVKLVIIVLLLASMWSWTIIFEKLTRLWRLKAKASNFDKEFWSGGSLDDLYDRLGDRPGHPMARIFVAGMREWRRATSEGKFTHSIGSRIEHRMNTVFTREMESLEARVGFLATTGAVAPFVGLFGTVWGIMNSFQAIAVEKNTSLVVVAPGIAEALFATALGLLAAIPAVVFYNKITSDIGRYASRMDGFADEFVNLVSKHIEQSDDA